MDLRWWKGYDAFQEIERKARGEIFRARRYNHAVRRYILLPAPCRYRTVTIVCAAFRQVRLCIRPEAARTGKTCASFRSFLSDFFQFLRVIRRYDISIYVFRCSMRENRPVEHAAFMESPWHPRSMKRILPDVRVSRCGIGRIIKTVGQLKINDDESIPFRDPETSTKRNEGDFHSFLTWPGWYPF